MSGSDRLTEQIRRVARQEAETVAPKMERFRVVRRKPLTLEALGSDVRLVDGNEDLDISRGVRHHAKVGLVVWVSKSPSGDYYVHSIASPHAGSNENGTGGGADEADEAGEAEGGVQALALVEALKTSGVGMVVGPGPRDPHFPFGHAIYASGEEPADPQPNDLWFKPE